MLREIHSSHIMVGWAFLIITNKVVTFMRLYHVTLYLYFFPAEEEESMEEKSMDVMVHQSDEHQGLEESMPLAMMILIPILSSGFILLILAVVCIRRQTKASAASSLTASPLVKMTSTNTASGAAASNEAMASRGVVSTSSSDHQANTTLQTLKRLSSLHFYAKPWAPTTTAPSSLIYAENHDLEDQPNDDEVESW